MTHMNKFLLILLFLFCVPELHSQPVSYPQAKDKAIAFFRQIENREKDLKSASMVEVDSFRTYAMVPSSGLKSSAVGGEPAFYIFNRIDAPGFVMVSAEEKIRDVLAWSEEANLCEIRPELKTVLDQYAREIALSRQMNVSSPAVSGSVVAAAESLLGNIMWNQSPAPFNSMCPADPATGRTCPAGCVATAMAQVLYYYKYPSTGTGSLTYRNDYGTVTVNFGETKYDYNAMSDQPPGGMANPEIARLLYHCGVSVETDYGPYGSSAYVGQIATALKSFYKYKEASVKYISSYTLDGWKALINKEIDNKRPVIYGALDPLDPEIKDDVTGGHAFILDGYDSNGLYHINWGWGGCSNGFYNLTLLNPEDCGDMYTFSDSHMMITGIEPLTTFDCLLSVDNESLQFDQRGGNKSLTISSNSTWTVSDNASWITVSTVSGSGNMNMTVGTTPNENFSERTGIITITACDRLITVKVVQEGTCSLTLSADKVSFSILEGSTKIGIKSTGSWLVTSNTPWINFSPSIGNGDDSLRISVSGNEGYVQRTGSITISACSSQKVISVSQNGSCILALETETLGFEASQGSREIRVESSNAWSVRSEVPWITVEPLTSGGSGTLKVSVSENFSNEKRSGNLTVSGCNDAKTITISQQGACYLDLATQNTEFDPSASDKFIRLSANTSWEAASDKSWILVSPSAGNGNGYLGIEVGVNTGQSPRSGIVTVTGCNSTRKITVIQQSHCPLDVSTALLDFSYVSGSKSATVNSTSAWTVTTETPWITVSPRSGSKIASFTVSVPGNSTREKRSGTVTITGCFQTKNVTVVQDRCSFQLSEQKLLFSPEQGTKSLNIQSTSSWSASANAKWVNVTPTFSVQGGNTSISVETNPSGRRSAEVTVSGCFSSEKVEIVQEGNPTPIDAVGNERCLVYPSLTSRYVKVEFPTASGTYSLEVYTEAGQKIITRQQLHPGEEIDLNGFAKGVYFFRVHNKSVLKTAKIVLR